MNITAILGLFLFLGAATSKVDVNYLKSYLPSWPQYEERWDWNNIGIDLQDADFLTKLGFPADFEFGVAASALQMEGTKMQAYVNGKLENAECINSWTELTKKDKNGKNVNWPQPHHANQHWDRWKEDIQRIKDLGVDAYRLSVDWSKIEPEEGVFNQAAIDHYKEIVKECKRLGIKPMVCFFHHTWPMWFDTKGAFEKAENNVYFVLFAERVFQELKEYVSDWMTFNEPEGFAMSAYFWDKKCPPGRTWELHTTGHVIKNMLDSHIAIYKIFKAHDEKCQVGFSKVVRPQHPYNPWNPVEQKICAFFNSLLHDVIYTYFKTGQYTWYGFKDAYNEDAKTSLDYIHLTYYSHTVLQIGPKHFGPILRPEEKEYVSDTGAAIYPEGLYESIKHAHESLPEWVKIYVGENGIAEAGDKHREEFIKKHLYAIKKAMNDGYKVHGYFYWCPIDTFNWSTYFKAKYGLYKVDMQYDEKNDTLTGTFDRSLRPSAKNFVNFMRSRKGMAPYQEPVKNEFLPEAYLLD